MELLKRATEYGVDFGNDRVVITAPRGQHCEFVSTESGRTTPSIMSFGEGKRIYGDLALHSQLQYINETITNMKYLIGVKFDSDEREKIEKRVQFKLCCMPDDTVGVSVDVNGEECHFSPEQIIAFLLKSIVKKGKEEKIDATFSTPANWNCEKRQRLSNAADIAGINARRMVNSTTAAAVNYVMSHKEKVPKSNDPPAIAAFIDLGDSLATCSIARIRYGSVKVLGTSTNSFVAGSNLTDLFADFLSDRVLNEFKVDVHKSKRTEYRFRVAVEKLKKTLSINSVAVLELPSMSDARDVKMNVKREEFTSVIGDYIDTLKGTFSRALEMSGVKKTDISIIEAFGGTSRIPLVKQTIQNFFGKAPTQSMNADECVALGVGFLAQERFPFIVGDVNLFDITAEWSQDGIKHSTTLFNSGCPVPSTHEFKLHISGSKIIRIKSNGDDIGNLEVFTDDEAPSDVRVTLALNSSSMLEVSTSTVKSEFNTISKLQPEELQALKDEEMSMELKDKEEEMIDNSRNRLETAMNSADTALLDAPNFIDYSSIEDFRKLLNDAKLWFEMNEYDRLPSKEYDSRAEQFENVANKALKLKQMYEDVQQKAKPYLDKVDALLKKAEAESDDHRLIGDLRKEKAELHRFFVPNTKEEPHFDEQITKRKIHALENSLSMAKFGGIKLTKC